jgi:hypothetical protein
MKSMMPIGFVWNTQEIYAEVASYPVVPPEKIKEYWTGIRTAHSPELGRQELTRA